MQLELFETPVKTEFNQEEGIKYCAGCDEHLPVDMFGKLLTTGSGKQFYQAKCRPCSASRASLISDIKKTAPPVPDTCDCCGKSFSTVVKKNIHMDHCEERGMFRGWLCQQCNVGIGYLGDDLEGVEKAATYLRNYYGQS